MTAGVSTVAGTWHPSTLDDTRRARGGSRLGSGWPLAAILVFYPVWWLLGVGPFILIIAAVPMGWYLVTRPRIAVPPGFGIWLSYLFLVCVSLLMVGANPPGTVPGSLSHRALAVGLRLLNYASVTIALLYAGNLADDVAMSRILRWLNAFCVIVVAGGLFALIDPHFQLTSPVERQLPGYLRDNTYVQNLVHPVSAQLQDVLGYTNSRPAAPFGYTNTWGMCLTILLTMFVASRLLRRGRARLFTVGLVVIAIIPIVYSLNRGVWIGLVLLTIYTFGRLMLMGRTWVLPLFAGLAIVAITTFAATPLHTVVGQRISHGHSNSLRWYTTVKSVQLTEHSPIVGYGSTRTVQGGPNSIAVGRSIDCPRCGNSVLGENGELWAVLVSNGFLGAALFLFFFLHAAWRFRRDRTPVGIAGVGILLLTVGFSTIYNFIDIPLLIIMLVYALLWVSDRQQAQSVAAAGATR